MTDIQTWVNFYSNNVCLAVLVKDDLSGEDGNLTNFGYIEINDETINYDNLHFFIHADYKKFKEQCKQELVDKGYKPKKIFREIKELIKRAKELNLLVC